MGYFSLQPLLSLVHFQEASDPQPYVPDAASEPFRYVFPGIPRLSLTENYPRAALEASSHTYLSSHFPDGIASVFSSPGDPATFIVQLIANRYNPSNYWYATSTDPICTCILIILLQVRKMEVRVRDKLRVKTNARKDRS